MSAINYSEINRVYDEYARTLSEELSNSYFTAKNRMLHSVAMLTRTSLHNTTVIEKYIPMLEASVSYTVHTNIYNN